MTRPEELPIRDDLVNVTEYGAPQLDVSVRINTNENPFEPSKGLVDSIVRRVEDAAMTINRYPDRDALELRTRLASYISESTGLNTGISFNNVWAANGSNEILQQLLQLFGGVGRSALGFEPTYSMHRIICRGTQTEYLSIDRNSDFTIPIASALDEIRSSRPDVVFVCSPNNPTGTTSPLDDIELLYEAIAEECNGVLIVDEAYWEFSSQESAVQLLEGRPRLIVSRTMSKAFSFAGARIGYLVGDPAVVEAVKRVRLPYHLSSITQAVGIAALAHHKELLEGVEVLKKQRDRIAEVSTLLGFLPIDSDANFVLVGGFGDQSKVWSRLVEQGVLVRDVGLDGYLRVSAGTIEETDRFLEVLESLTK